MDLVRGKIGKEKHGILFLLLFRRTGGRSDPGQPLKVLGVILTDTLNLNIMSKMDEDLCFR
jgi:hypothetical protein